MERELNTNTNNPNAMMNSAGEASLPRSRKVPDLLPPQTNGHHSLPEISPTSKEFRESSSFATRRKSSQLLSPLKLRQTPQGVDSIDGQQSRVEVEEEGVTLFNEFLEGELQRNGIMENFEIAGAVTSATVQSKKEEPAVNVSAFQFRQHTTTTSARPSGDGSMTPSLQKYSNPKWARNGRDLRKLADQFASSRERQGVRDKAKETAGDAEITAAMFWDMLSELFFQGNVTRERIVVLFFFCSDVAICALQRNSVEYFHRFMVWALQYIRRHVCSWVASNGGWEAVLYASASHLVSVGKVVAVAVLVYAVFKLGKTAVASITKR